jgi:hypothetical protein
MKFFKPYESFCLSETDSEIAKMAEFCPWKFSWPNVFTQPGLNPEVGGPWLIERRRRILVVSSPSQPRPSYTQQRKKIRRKLTSPFNV